VLDNGTTISSKAGNLTVLEPGEFLVRIVKCKNEYYWYSKMMGRQFVVTSYNEYNYKTVNGRALNQGIENYITKEDVEVLYACDE
jgi:hypothetical protein